MFVAAVTTRNHRKPQACGATLSPPRQPRGAERVTGDAATSGFSLACPADAALRAAFACTTSPAPSLTLTARAARPAGPLTVRVPASNPTEPGQSAGTWAFATFASGAGGADLDGAGELELEDVAALEARYGGAPDVAATGGVAADAMEVDSAPAAADAPTNAEVNQGFGGDGAAACK